jgi:hypothetical protein
VTFTKVKIKGPQLLFASSKLLRILICKFNFFHQSDVSKILTSFCLESFVELPFNVIKNNSKYIKTDVVYVFSIEYLFTLSEISIHVSV